MTFDKLDEFESFKFKGILLQLNGKQEQEQQEQPRDLVIKSRRIKTWHLFHYILPQAKQIYLAS